MAANMHLDYADRKNGRKPVSCVHPELEELLGDTYGLMIYQESMMRVAQRFAGYSLEEADNLRKACGKKIRTLIQAERVSTEPESSPGEPADQVPTVARALQGSTRETGGCLMLRPMRGVNSFASQPSIPPPPSGQASSGAPALAEVRLPPGGASIVAARPAQVAVRIGRFAEPPRLPLTMPGAGRYTSLAIPQDGAAMPWRLIVYSPKPVSMCGLADG